MPPALGAAGRCCLRLLPLACRCCHVIASTVCHLSVDISFLCRAASQLEYELTHSVPGDSWTLTAAITQQANVKSVDIWCSGCSGRSLGSGIIARLAVQSEDSSTIGSTSSVALVLTDAWLPAQQTRKLQQQVRRSPVTKGIWFH